MTLKEKEEISKLPVKYQLMTAWGYFWLIILYVLPIVGTVFLIIHCISDANINRRSYARSYFCGLIFRIILFIILIFILVITGALTSALAQ